MLSTTTCLDGRSNMTRRARRNADRLANSIRCPPNASRILFHAPNLTPVLQIRPTCSSTERRAGPVVPRPTSPSRRLVLGATSLATTGASEAVREPQASPTLR